MRGVLFDCLLSECGFAIVHELLGFFIFTLCYFVGSPERASKSISTELHYSLDRVEGACLG